MIDVLKIFAIIFCAAFFLIFSMVFSLGIVHGHLVRSLKEVVDYYLSKKREMMLELEKEFGDGARRLN